MLPVPDLGMIQCAWITIRSGTHCLYGFLLFVAGDHFFPQYLKDDGLSDLEGWTGKNCQIFILQSPSAQWIDYSRKNDTLWWKLFDSATRAKHASHASSHSSMIADSLLKSELNVATWIRARENQDNIEQEKLPAPHKVFQREMELQALPQDILGANPTLNAGAGYWEEVLQVSRAHKKNIPSGTDFFGAIKDDMVLHIENKVYSLAQLFSPCVNQFQHAQEIQKILHRFNLEPTDHPCLIFFKDLNDTNAWFVDLKDLLNVEIPSLRSELKKWFGSQEFAALLAKAQNA